VVEKDKGISVRRPAGWSDSRRNGAVTVQSHDRCLVMTLSAPGAASRSKGLRSDAVAVFRRSYKNARVGSAPSSRVGGIPTTSNAISFTDPKGNPIKVLLSVGTGDKYAYLTEVVVRDPSCQGDLQLANLMLGSIQYTQ